MQQFLGPPFGYLGAYGKEDIKELEDGIELYKKILEWETAFGHGKRRKLKTHTNGKGQTP